MTRSPSLILRVATAILVLQFIAASIPVALGQQNGSSNKATVNTNRSPYYTANVVSGQGKFISFLARTPDLSEPDTAFAKAEYDTKPNMPLLPGDRVRCLKGRLALNIYGETTIVKKNKMVIIPAPPRSDPADLPRPELYFFRGGRARGRGFLLSPSNTADSRVLPSTFQLAWSNISSKTTDKLNITIRLRKSVVWEGTAAISAGSIKDSALRIALSSIWDREPNARLTCIVTLPGGKKETATFSFFPKQDVKPFQDELQRAQAWQSLYLRNIMVASTYNKYGLRYEGANACVRAAQSVNRPDLYEAAALMLDRIGDRPRADSLRQQLLARPKSNK